MLSGAIILAGLTALIFLAEPFAKRLSAHQAITRRLGKPLKRGRG